MANIYSMVDTWNDAGTTFTGIGLNVTDTDSASDSLLMDLQVGGSSKFSVRKNGHIGILTAPSLSFAIKTPGTISALQYNLSAASGAVYWSDLALYRDAAGTLAQRNSTNAQTFNLYNTYTDASNYERGFMKWNSNVLEIGTEGAGTGTARNVTIQRSSGASAKLYGSELHLAPTTNSIDVLILKATAIEPNADNRYSLGTASKGFSSLYVSGATVVLSALPTSDPVSAGQLWNDAGTLKISAG